MTAATVTRQGARVLAYIAAYRQDHGYPPTLREIGAHLGVGLTATAHHVRKLRESGHLTGGHLPRTLTITQPEETK